MSLTSIQSANARHNVAIERLFEELSQHSEAVLNRAPANGGWTAMQNVHHLILAERFALSYVLKKMADETNFEPANLRSWWRSLLLQMYMRLPKKIQAPPAVGGNPEVLPAYSTIVEAKAVWQAVRTEWTQFFEGLSPALADKLVYKHPAAGRLSWLGMIGFWSVHLDRHTKQIRRTITAS
jgi:hypothetical protein